MPTAKSLCLLLISILALENADSIRSFYRHFISKITQKSLNVFYYACSYTQVDYSEFMCTTVRMVLKIIPKHISYHPFFLCIDDTNVIFMFDSWYAKKALTCVVDEFFNLDIICAARVDSVIYDIAPKRTGKAGHLCNLFPLQIQK